MKNFYSGSRLLQIAVAFLFAISFHTTASAYQMMSTNFYIVDSKGATLKDGNITIYDNQYNDGIDWNDGTKMNNMGENWGLIRNNVSLVVERRKLVTGPDTAYFNMWGMQLRNYRFEITMENFDSATTAAYVWDDYLKSMTPVSFSKITTINFSVDNNAASKAAKRFKIIYTTPANYAIMYATNKGIKPVTLDGITAGRESNSIKVNWQVDNENIMNNYELQESADGIHFNTIATVNALNTKGNLSYSYTDNAALKTIEYYRIKANGNYGDPLLSDIVKVDAVPGAIETIVNVYPNPVTNKTVKLNWENAATGNWAVSLVMPNGSALPLQTQVINAGRAQTTLALPAGISPGVYSLYMKNATGKSLVKTIIVL
ncbi:MAG: T9SS type A sorting domain-containing protein [Bacteroidetes bacterium]|nr:T9SS type A sorting domain-containing protein [Bacteroidota bacterium]MBS1756418.1 T9SS type A sorting domain-containing protein [Bacteroidota bacterium]